MKLFLLLLLFPAIAFSQKLKVNEIDKFTKQRRLETERVWLKNRSGDGVAVSFRSADTTCFITFYGYGRAAGVIGDGDKMIMLLDNDSTVTVYSTGIQTYDIRVGGTSTYNHQYSIEKDDLNKLSTHNVKSLRKYLSDGYVDIDIPEKHQDEIKELAILFIGALGILSW
jgi:hypothetical protein